MTDLGTVNLQFTIISEIPTVAARLISAQGARMVCAHGWHEGLSLNVEVDRRRNGFRPGDTYDVRLSWLRPQDTQHEEAARLILTDQLRGMTDD